MIAKRRSLIRPSLAFPPRRWGAYKGQAMTHILHTVRELLLLPFRAWGDNILCIGFGRFGFKIDSRCVHVWASERHGLYWNWREGYACAEGGHLQSGS